MADRPPRIFVLAGTNGAGKSSIGGAMFRESRADYFNPDEAARRIRSAEPGLTQAEANSAACHQGRRLLERAIASRLDFAFESTLGGSTIPALLAEAASLGIEVRIWYVGLTSPEQTGRLNVIHLLPRLTELCVHDNSFNADPGTGAAPVPLLVLHVRNGRIVAPRDLSATQEWAKPLVAAAMRLDAAARRRLR